MLGLLLIRGALWRHSEEVLSVPVILRPQADESYSTDLLLVVLPVGDWRFKILRSAQDDKKRMPERLVF